MGCSFILVFRHPDKCWALLIQVSVVPVVSGYILRVLCNDSCEIPNPVPLCAYAYFKTLSKAFVFHFISCHFSVLRNTYYEIR